MFEHHLYRSVIPPVSEGFPRPLWSVMIPTYNCAEYLRETLASVLSQAPSPEIMQIEVIDDYSTKDDPEAVVREVAGDRVSFYRQPENVGYIKNFETCLQRSRGQIVHLLHGDDCVRDGFYKKMQQLFENYPEIGAAFCRTIFANDEGHWQQFSTLQQPQSGILQNSLECLASKHPVQTPSIVVRREVYEELGGFDRRMASCAEDWEMWVRIAANFPIGYEVKPLALYRDRSESLTKRSVRTGQNVRDVRTATNIIRTYLPQEKANKIIHEVGEAWADWALYFAHCMITQGDLASAIIQIQEGLKCSRSGRVIRRAAKLALKAGSQWFQQSFSPTISFPCEQSAKL